MTEQPFDPWKDSWAFTPRYERWIESLEVPIHRAYYIDDLRTIEVGPWEDQEINTAVVVLEGNKDFMETRLTEIPPAGTARPMKFSLDDIIYVVSGYGMATVWSDDGGPKRTFEWQPHSLFFIPRNYTYQLSNAQGHLPARLLHYNYLPMAMSMIPEPDYFFNNPALKPSFDLMGGEDHNVYSEAKWVPTARRGRRGGWVASFFPDLMAFDKVHHNEGQGVLPNLSYCLPNVTSLRIGGRVLPPGTYKPAHYHGAGAIIVIPGGEGFSLMWPVFDDTQEKMLIPWHEGSLIGPPNLWYHQHMNSGTESTRYITLHPARHIEPEYQGSQIHYADEDPWIRKTFEEALAKHGTKSQMPDGLYESRDFKWEAPGDD
jgi:oxalate decarboxylase/phosphoglucose isomerase-like protein (cupin superfamily)